MQLLQGSSLGQTFRNLSDQVSEEVRIISPYIGRWPAVSSLLGDSWWSNSFVQLRAITDISDTNNVELGTLAWLTKRGTVKTLTGVHAKLYAFDDQCIVTSVNLTETGFTKRYEIGVLLTPDESEPFIALFDTWWASLCSDIGPEDLLKLEASKKFASFPEPEDERYQLKQLWSLPQRPNPVKFETEDAGEYAKYLQAYKELSAVYQSKQRLWSDAPLYLEVDAFLNFLFHAGDKPSKAYASQKTARVLSSSEREIEVEQLGRSFSVWLRDHPEQKDQRLERLETVHSLLAPTNILNLSMADVSTVLDQIHAMGSTPFPKPNFLKSNAENLEGIRSAWQHLLFGKGSEQERIEKCQERLYNFGPSSTQELLGCYYPDKYPLRNDNSNAGMRYLGFTV